MTNLLSKNNFFLFFFLVKKKEKKWRFMLKMVVFKTKKMFVLFLKLLENLFEIIKKKLTLTFFFPIF